MAIKLIRPRCVTTGGGGGGTSLPYFLPFSPPYILLPSLYLRQPCSLCRVFTLSTQTLEPFGWDLCFVDR